MSQPDEYSDVPNLGAEAEIARGPVVSFVIPARNEARLIGETVRAIHTAMTGTCEYQVVVVDNGSTDSTGEVATAEGATVIRKTVGTIGSLRNEGVRRTTGAYLVFLDADVLLSAMWGRQLPSTIASLRREPDLVTGSMALVGEGSGWLERYWFAARDDSSFSHIGSAHMIVSREFFDRVGGFSEVLETGEDYDFSRRAVEAGGRISPDRRLVAEHRRYPRTALEFVSREAWHGRSDVSSLGAVVRSKVALAAIVFAVGHLVAAAAVVMGRFGASVLALGLVASICVSSSVLKYRGRNWRVIFVNTAVFYLYYTGRVLSLLGPRSSGGGAWMRT